MDPMKILKRAWNILWSYRALWVFGIIIAIATAGGMSSGGGGGGGRGGGSDSGSSAQFPDGPFDFGFGADQPDSVADFFQIMGAAYQEVVASEPMVGEVITILIVLLCLAIFFALLWAIVRYVSEAALVKMVNAYEEDGIRLSVRQGFRLGWSRTAWRFFLINLIVSLPAILTALFLAAVIGGVVAYLVTTEGSALAIPLIVILVGVAFVSMFFIIILSVLLNLLRQFFWRASALEELGVIEALRRGFDMVRENLKDVGIMWLIMVGLEIAWGVLMIPAFFLMLPLLAATGLVGLLLGGLPALAIGGITSLFLSSPINWILGGLIGIIILFIVMFLPFTLLSGLKETFRSTVWTLVYREINLAAGLLPAVIGDEEM